MELRNYQLDLVGKIQELWEKNYQNIFVQLETGAGKTVIFSYLIKQHKGACVLIAHRDTIVAQISRTLARFGIRHNLIAQKPTIRNIIGIHMREFNQSFYDRNAQCTIASIDTLIARPAAPWMKSVTLLVQDEAHHVLRANKWGKAAALFPSAKGLYPTAVPLRADGHGLGRHADGVGDILLRGPSMSWLMNEGYLCNYRIFAPPSDLDLSNVKITASGDYSDPALRTAVHKSKITGDIVQHYLRIAPGKLGITFAVDINAAREIAQEFRDNGVPAEVISSETPLILRYELLRKFEARLIVQLVNVDLFGEGTDIPAIEVVSLGRPTASLNTFLQQLGRVLRILLGKTHGIIIDHVGNVIRHGLPDMKREYSLDRRDKKSKAPSAEVQLRSCLNPSCLAVYERYNVACPYCGFKPVPVSRKTIEAVDGDLIELSPEVLARLRGDIEDIDADPIISPYLPLVAQRALSKRHKEKQATQTTLREAIALYAGYYKHKGARDSEIYKRFYLQFNVDILSAQSLGTQDAGELQLKIYDVLPIDGSVNSGVQ